MIIKNVPDSTGGNILNGGFTARGGDWIYYRNFSEGSRLFKVRRDGSGRERLSDCVPRYINADCEGVYYIDDSDCSIYTIKNGSSLKTKLLGSNAYENLMLKVDMLYYQVGDLLCRVRKDGTNIEQLVSRDVMTSFISNEDWVYYLCFYDTAKIWRNRHCITKPFENTSEVVVGDTHALIFLADDRRIYYYNGVQESIELPSLVQIESCEYYYIGNLYSIDLESKKVAKLSEDLVKTINIDDEYIYYVNCSENCTLYRIRKEGSERKRLSGIDGIRFINLIDDWVYYHTRNSLYRVRKDGSCEEAFK